MFNRTDHENSMDEQARWRITMGYIYMGLDIAPGHNSNELVAFGCLSDFIKAIFDVDRRTGKRFCCGNSFNDASLT